MSEGIEYFRNAIKPFFEDWKSIDLRVIAIRSSEGKWIFNSIKAIFDSANPNLPVTQNLPNIQHLFVAHERWPITQLDKLLNSISKGVLTICNENIEIKWFNGNDWIPPTPIRFEFINRDWAQTRFKLDNAAYQLSTSSSSSNAFSRELLEQIKTSLRCYDPPWENLSDLREDFIGLSQRYASNEENSSVYILAPMGVRLADSSTIHGQSININIEKSPGIKGKDIFFSIIAKTQGDSRIRLRKPSSKIGNTNQLLNTKIKLPISPSNVKLIVCYKGVDVDEKELFGKGQPFVNPRIAALENIGMGIDGLEKLFESARGHRLENGVALLLHLLGFSPAPYGLTQQEVPDIIAFPDEGNWFLVVECTESNIDANNKLSKLAMRTKKIQNDIKGFKPYPVLITKLDRKMINSTDLDKAAKEQIVIVAREELQHLIRMTMEEIKPSKVQKYLDEHISYWGVVP